MSLSTEKTSSEKHPLPGLLSESISSEPRKDNLTSSSVCGRLQLATNIVEEPLDSECSTPTNVFNPSVSKLRKEIIKVSIASSQQ